MKKVIVTGGTGFVAGWVIVEFLKAGYQVGTSVRSMKKTERLEKEIAAAVSTEEMANLSFFEADLTSSKNLLYASLVLIALKTSPCACI